MRAAISFVALRECSASLRTSSATTAKPRPASPARAASMAALRARRLVCSVMSLITLMISEISNERSPSDLIFFAVACTDARMRCIPSSVSRTARLPCSGIECPACGLRTCLGVVRHLLHRHCELFHGRGGIRNLLVLLGRTCGHFVGGDKNVVCAAVYVDCRLPDALNKRGEVVEHQVYRINHIPKRVIGDFPAQGQIAARHLINEV